MTKMARLSITKQGRFLLLYYTDIAHTHSHKFSWSYSWSWSYFSVYFSCKLQKFKVSQCSSALLKYGQMLLFWLYTLLS